MLPQVETPSRIKMYSWWNTVIRSGKMRFMYLSMDTILHPGQFLQMFDHHGSGQDSFGVQHLGCCGLLKS